MNLWNIWKPFLQPANYRCTSRYIFWLQIKIQFELQSIKCLADWLNPLKYYSSTHWCLVFRISIHWRFYQYQKFLQRKVCKDRCQYLCNLPHFSKTFSMILWIFRSECLNLKCKRVQFFFSFNIFCQNCSAVFMNFAVFASKPFCVIALEVKILMTYLKNFLEHIKTFFWIPQFVQ